MQQESRHSPASVLLLSILGTLWLSACGDNYVSNDASSIDASPIDAEPARVTATFVAPTPGAGADFGTLPFPSDLYLDSNGFLALGAIPIGSLPQQSFVDIFVEQVATMRGAGVSSNVYFPLDGNPDLATFTGNVKIVDLDNALAEIPIDLMWRPDFQTIVALPQLGNVFRQDHRYAAYVTDQVTGENGLPLVRAADFDEAVDLTAVPSDTAILAAQTNLRPLIEALPQSTVDSLVTATVFTTQNVTDVLKAMRDVVAATPPAVSAISVRVDLNTLFGVQSPTAPPGVGAGGRNQPHGNVAAVIQGTIGLSSFITDTPGIAGLVTFDGNNIPIVKGVDNVPFTLILPVGISYAGLPVMIHASPFARTRVDLLLHADALAAKGIATLEIDTIHHGSRLQGFFDDQNDITGDQNPDGFGDANALSAIKFLHLQASGGLPNRHTGVIRDNVRQAVVDLCSLASFVKGGDPTAINAALLAAGLPNDLSFHTDAPAISGDSLGAMLVTIATAVDPNLNISMPNVSPAGLPFPTFLHSPAFSDVGTNELMVPLGLDERIILGDPVFDPRFDVVVMLLGNLIEAGDTISYAPYILSGEIRGDSGPSFVLNQAWGDEWVPNIATEHLAGIIGLPHMVLNLATPPPSDPWMRFVTLNEIASPVAGNLTASQTAAFVLWHPATHGLFYFYEDTFNLDPTFPPFNFFQTPVLMNNFTVEAQGMRADFLDDYFSGRTPTIVDPF